jgi:hypothetical protein
MLYELGNSLTCSKQAAQLTTVSEMMLRLCVTKSWRFCSLTDNTDHCKNT